MFYNLRCIEVSAASVTPGIGVISRSGVQFRRYETSSHNAGVLSRLYRDDVTKLLQSDSLPLLISAINVRSVSAESLDESDSKSESLKLAASQT